MEKNTKEQDKLDYFLYVKDELSRYDLSGTLLIQEKISKIDVEDIKDSDIKDVCKYVEFLEISEKIKIYLFHEWFRYLKLF